MDFVAQIPYWTLAVIAGVAAWKWAERVDRENYNRAVKQQLEFERELELTTEARDDDDAVAMAAMFAAISAREPIDKTTTDNSDSDTNSESEQT